MPPRVADRICERLGGEGVSVVFGVPGSQNIDLWDALRRSPLRTVVPTSELSASFMAAGYARASGRLGVLVTIGDPGFAFAIPGLVEAALGSVPLVHLAAPARSAFAETAGSFAQSRLAALLAKAAFTPTRPADVDGAVREACATARAGEPGPVVVEVGDKLLSCTAAEGRAAGPDTHPVDEAVVEQICEELLAARRPLFFCGAGVADAARELVQLVEQLGAPVLTTTSGRGIIPETHPLCVRHDVPGEAVEIVNELMESADLIIVLGARLSENSTHGGRLRLPSERVVRVDASPDALAGPHPARTTILAHAPTLVRTLTERIGGRSRPSEWQPAEMERWRRRIGKASSSSLPEPRLGSVDAHEFFTALRRVLPAAVPIATDSGLHQSLARSYLTVLAPRTLLTPVGFQSMGFGIPTAIGAAIATDGPAVAVVGDGGFNINGLELLTAVRENLSLAVIVVVDGEYGLIRAQQLRRTGRSSGVAIPVADLRRFAESVGARYLALTDGDPAPLSDALRTGGVTLAELPANDTVAVRRTQARGIAASIVRSTASATRQILRGANTRDT